MTTGRINQVTTVARLPPRGGPGLTPRGPKGTGSAAPTGSPSLRTETTTNTTTQTLLANPPATRPQETGTGRAGPPPRGATSTHRRSTTIPKLARSHCCPHGGKRRNQPTPHTLHPTGTTGDTPTAHTPSGEKSARRPARPASEHNPSDTPATSPARSRLSQGCTSRCPPL